MQHPIPSPAARPDRHRFPYAPIPRLTPCPSWAPRAILCIVGPSSKSRTGASEPALGVFAKVVRDRPVKTRLRLSRREAERFYVSSLADTLETSLRVVDAPTLFLEGREDAAAVVDLQERMHALGFDSRLWRRIDVRVQRGADLGERLEAAFAEICAAGANRGETPHPGFIIGSDSPSVDALMLERGLERLRIPAPEPAGFAPSRSDAATAASAAQFPPDVVLGPTADGGYWAIGVRRPV